MPVPPTDAHVLVPARAGKEVTGTSECHL